MQGVQYKRIKYYLKMTSNRHFNIVAFMPKISV